MVKAEQKIQLNTPFLLKPVGKDYLWGGSRLNDDFSKAIDLDPLAETWECSTHPDGPSQIASGPYTGKLLRDVLAAHPEYIGTHPATTMELPPGELPVLIKLIDAKSDLSVQVHPDDAYARRFENGSMGKTEMWYILDATKDASLIYGFSHDIDESKLRKSLLDGTVERYLQRVPIEKDDMFFIEAGTVHAIGAGSLIAEVQENSNITYRMYDYDRVDRNGNRRPLHIDKALSVANLKHSAAPRQPQHIYRYQKGYASEFLCRCKYFQAERLMVNTERCRDLARLQTDSTSFQVLLCTNGCGALVYTTDALTTEVIQFFRGDCIFLPANSVELQLHGKAHFLKVHC